MVVAGLILYSSAGDVYFKEEIEYTHTMGENDLEIGAHAAESTEGKDMEEQELLETPSSYIDSASSVSVGYPQPVKSRQVGNTSQS